MLAQKNYTHFHLLSEVGEHDDGEHIVVPDKSPEVAHSVRQSPLGGNVLIVPIVPL